MQVKHGINFPHPPPLQLPIPPTPSRRRRPSSTVTGQLTQATFRRTQKKKGTATSGKKKKKKTHGHWVRDPVTFPALKKTDNFPATLSPSPATFLPNSASKIDSNA
jgi:hypothetical protein